MSDRTVGAAGGIGNRPYRRMHGLPSLLLGAVAVAVLAGCAGSGSGGQVPGRQGSADPQVLQGKLSAVMSDECYTGNPRTVYPACDKYFTELVGTKNAVRSMLHGKPKPVHRAYQQLKRGTRKYDATRCGTRDKRIDPSKTDACANALRLTHTGLRGVYDGLYPHGS